MNIQAIGSGSTNSVQAAEKSSTNILFRIQALVFRINTQLSRLSEETQTRSQTMKKEYRVSSDKSASLQQKIGNFAPVIASLSLLTIFAAPAIAHHFHIQEDLSMSFNKSLADQIVPSCGQLITSNLSASQMRAQSISGLRQTEIGNEGQKTGEARDLQSELQQLLSNIRELYKKASS